jgi:serine/threonine-protein kinase
LEGALALPEPARNAFIKRACGGDAQLEQEVRSILHHHVPPSQAGTEPSAPEDVKDLTGKTVGRFRIVSLLGTGGMGVVWKAEDTSLGRAVAIKFLPPEQAKSELARRRFLREAGAAANLSHASLATVYDVGEHDGEPYIAMQIVEGRTVGQRLKQQSYAPAEAVRIIVQAARAIDYAHTQGVVHRDVKPGNIIVTNEGAVVVLDFGVALRSTDTSRLSRTGELVGTIGYMAPEVIVGDDANAQSDVYSLAVCLYQMLTGFTPFDLNRGDAKPGTKELHPEPVSRLVRGIPKDLDRVMAKALARTASSRPASAGEFANSLEALLRNGSLSRYPRAASRRPRPRPALNGWSRLRDLLRMHRERRSPTPIDTRVNT